MSTFSPSEPLPRIAPHWAALEALAATRSGAEIDQVDGVVPVRVVTPVNTEQVSAVMAWANESGVRVVPRGGGTKLEWGNASGADVVLSVEKLTRIIDHAWQDMTVTVQAGAKIESLQADLAMRRQRLPLDAMWPERSTVGGVIATNDSGALRLRFGSVRDLILGVTVVLANGTVAHSGGRVVKNVAGYDLPKLFTGSFGTLGVITEVTLRTYPQPHNAKTISFQFADIKSANRYMVAVADTTLVPAAMQLRVESGAAPVVDVLFEGLQEGIEAQEEQATRLALGARKSEVERPWEFRSSMSAVKGAACIAKFSVLPNRVAECIAAIDATGATYYVIAQSLGLGLVRLHTPAEQLLKSLTDIRQSLRKHGGTLALLDAPVTIKKSMDVFGETTSAHPIMVRVKQQFDPKGILSPGRFLGGI